MDNQSWDKAKIADWKRFWESDLGCDYLAKLEEIKESIFMGIMNNADKDMLANLAGRAAGIEIVIQDIKQGIIAANENEKEEKAVKK